MLLRPLDSQGVWWLKREEGRAGLLSRVVQEGTQARGTGAQVGTSGVALGCW